MAESGMVMSKSLAVEMVSDLLRGMLGENLEIGEHKVVIQDDRVEDYGDAWSVPFNTSAYLDGGSPADGLIPCVAIVPKSGGSGAHFAPTAVPIDEYIRRVRAGEMDWVTET